MELVKNERSALSGGIGFVVCWKRRIEKRSRKAAVLRLKSERDCRFYQKDKGKRTAQEREMPISWQLRKGKGGLKKSVLH
jgi:hypothetical protein